MRFAPIANLMGWTLTVVSIPMFVIGLSAFILQEDATEFFIRAFLIPVLLGLVTGLIMIRKSRNTISSKYYLVLCIYVYQVSSYSSNNSQSVRNIFGAGQGKQAVGVYCSNYRNI